MSAPTSAGNCRGGSQMPKSTCVVRGTIILEGTGTTSGMMRDPGKMAGRVGASGLIWRLSRHTGYEGLSLEGEAASSIFDGDMFSSVGKTVVGSVGSGNKAHGCKGRSGRRVRGEPDDGIAAACSTRSGVVGGERRFGFVAEEVFPGFVMLVLGEARIWPREN